MRLSSLVAVVLFTAAWAFSAELTSVRLRFAWGGGEPSRWVGQIAVDGGQLSNLQLLATAPDEACSIWPEGDTLRINTLGPHAFHGVDITVEAPSDAVLQVALQGDAGPLVPVELPLAEVLAGVHRTTLDQRGNTLEIRRTPGDALRIETDRRQLFFSPGEEFALTLWPALPEVRGGESIELKLELVTARGRKARWSQNHRLPVPFEDRPKLDLAIPLPLDPGVYTLQIAASQPPGFRERFNFKGGQRLLADRNIQVLVLGSEPSTATRLSAWNAAGEIDPTSSRLWTRLPEWTQWHRLMGGGPVQRGSITPRIEEHPTGNLLTLPAMGTTGDAHWQAFTLPVKKPHTPYLVEIAYPADKPMQMGLAIIEADATGKVINTGRDWGVYIDPHATSKSDTLHRQRLLFWPRSEAPVLLVTNRSPTADCRFGKIRLFEGGDATSPAVAATHHLNERLMAAYVAEPAFAELFDANKTVDPVSGQVVDNWQTFYEGAERLADYLAYAGYNAAIVSVEGEGGLLYPSALAHSTPQWDSSVLADGADDLSRKDVLELLLRVFDQRGLALVPAIEFNHPITNLEPLRRRSDSRAVGIEPVAASGQTWWQVAGATRGVAPRYNLLNSQVQDNLAEVVRELVERYGHHPAMAGLAVNLSADSHAVLPGPEWCLDDATLREFADETGIVVPGGGEQRFATREEFLLGDRREAWLDWRAKRLTAFYTRLASVVRATDDRRQLVLTTHRLFESDDFRHRLRPEVATLPRLDELMLAQGIDFDELALLPGVAPLWPHFVAPALPLTDRAIDLQVNEAAYRQQLASAGLTSGQLFVHRARPLRLASFDANSPFGQENTQLALRTHATADGFAVRRRYIESYSAGDPLLLADGGQLLAVGQEDAVREIRHVLRQLPSIEPRETKRQQPLVVRTYGDAGTTTIGVANESPWPIEAVLTLEVGERADSRLLGSETAGSLDSSIKTFHAGQHLWTLRLGPFDLQAAQFTSTKVQVSGVRLVVSGEARQQLAARVDDLNRRDLTSESQYLVLDNAGFEPLGAVGPVPGWQIVGPQESTTAELAGTSPLVGQTNLYLESRGAGCAVVSGDFPTPPTGQLAMTVAVRGTPQAPETELRLVLETTTGPAYRRWALLGGGHPRAQKLGQQWQWYTLGVDDLPLDSRGRMRLRFEIVGQGEVEIDEVRLHDLLFPFEKFGQSRRLALVKKIHAAQSALDDGQLTDCLRLLDSYWPRFIAEYTAISSPELDNVETTVIRQPPAEAAQPSEQESPSMTERLRRFFFR